MRILMKIVFCALVVLVSSSQQTKDQSTPPAPILTSQTGSAQSSLLPFVAGDEVVEPKPNPTNLASTDPDGDLIKTAATERDGIVQSDTVSEAGARNDMAVTPMNATPAHVVYTHTPSQAPGPLNAATDSPSSPPPTPSITTATALSFTSLLAKELATPSRSPATHPSLLSLGSTATAETPSQPSTPAPVPSITQAPSTGRTQPSAPAHVPAGPVQSELNVGDEDSTPHRSSSLLDPLLAGLVSVFIVTTGIISVVLFLKFRQRIDHPEFHRLQDLPMDDLMEDTPLSRFSY